MDKKKIWYIYTVEYHTAVKLKKLLHSATAWMDQEKIILTKLSQLVKEKYHMISLI